ncbi:MAG: T9SS type A sorting domain-containing protein, partial [Bacteroidota bacterium]
TWTGPSGYLADGREATIRTPGMYTLTIVDPIECTVATTFEVTIDDETLVADFLVAGTAYVGDTLVVIDISWPVPDRVEWVLPEEAEVVSQTEDFVEVVFDQAGSYPLKMYGELAGCSASFAQVITIEDRTGASDTSVFVFAEPNEAVIQGVEVYPNPATEQFNVAVELNESAPVQLRLVDLEGNHIPYHEVMEGLEEYEVGIDASALRPGVYFLQVVSQKEIKTRRIMIQ